MFSQPQDHIDMVSLKKEKRDNNKVQLSERQFYKKGLDFIMTKGEELETVEMTTRTAMVKNNQLCGKREEAGLEGTGAVAAV